MILQRKFVDLTLKPYTYKFNFLLEGDCLIREPNETLWYKGNEMTSFGITKLQVLEHRTSDPWNTL